MSAAQSSAQKQRDKVLAVLVDAWPKPVSKKQMLAACLPSHAIDRQQQIVGLAEAIRELQQRELIRFVDPVESGIEAGAWAMSEQFVRQSMVMDNDVSADFPLMSIYGDDKRDAPQDNEQWPATERQTLSLGASDGH